MERDNDKPLMVAIPVMTREMVNWFKTRVNKALQLMPRYCLPRPKPFLLLDAGCGDGVQSVAFLTYFPKCTVVAMDIRDSNVREATLHAQAFSRRFQAIHADYHEMPFLDGIFDVVLLGFSLHETRNKLGVLEEALRVLKSSGRMFVVDYQVEAPTYWIPPEYKIAPQKLLDLAQAPLPNTSARLLHGTKRMYLIEIRKNGPAHE